MLPYTSGTQPTKLRMRNNSQHFWWSHLQMHMYVQNWRSQFGLQWICVGFSSSSINCWICPPKLHSEHQATTLPPFWPSLLSLDLSVDPYPASPPNTTQGCTFTTVGANITLRSLLPKPTVDTTYPDVLQIIAANLSRPNKSTGKINCFYVYIILY